LPIYTFTCATGHTQEVLCRHNEKDTLVESCKECGELSRHVGAPELIQTRDFSKGKYRMHAIGADGSKHRVNNVRTSAKRSDS